MGGMGSGGRSERATTADAFALDVGRLHRAGALVPGWSGGWQWTRNGERTAYVGITVTDTSLMLTYRARQGNDPWRDVAQPVAVVWSACRFGGRRPFLCCPSCGRQVMTLYLRIAVRCRACHRLAYPSQRERAGDRAHRRHNKIRGKLGGELGVANPFPARPKGMHWQTYHSLQWRALKAADVANAELVIEYGRIFRRLGIRDWDEGFGR